MPSSLTEDQLEAMERNALLNAVAHGGKSEMGAVVSKSLGESPELRAMAKDVARAAAEVVARVNSLSPEGQQKLLEERYPDALLARDQKKAMQRADDKAHANQFPPLPNATKGKVVLRLPPEPSGYMTIGHAMAGVINAAYRDMYEGELWLRFEDTNPKKVRSDYYQSFRDGYTWVGIRWDHEKNVSSDMEVLYYHARRLIEMGAAYACSCPADLVKKLRGEGKGCEHRGRSLEQNIAVWEGMLARKYKEGEWVIRLKGDMEDLDTSLRDPNILRVITASHPVVGTKYAVWPVYDFEVVVEDKLCEVTHILRSSEFHVSLQDKIRDLLGFPAVVVEQFSRFNFKGTPVSKRLLRPLVEEKVVTGWDDPRMPTVEGVKRRGIVPEAIRQFTLQVGYGKTEHTFDWSLLFAVNRKILDPVSIRIFFAPEPLLLKLKGAPRRELSLPFHPTYETLGKREIDVPANPELWVPQADVKEMKAGEVFRLMDLYNVRLTKRGKVSEAEYIGDERLQEIRKVQWVEDGGKKEVKVLEPHELFLDDETPNPDSLKVRKGYAEAAFSDLSEGDIVQFPRYGFVRVDGPGRCILAHP